MMRRYFFIMTLAWMLPIVLFTGISLLIDPYRIFHRPWVQDNYYVFNRGMRVEAAGIINTEDFESIILGSSMAANFSAQEATRSLGSKFVNISLWGSFIKERAYVLEYALRKKPVKNVIYSLDSFSFYKLPSSGMLLEPHKYLYDNDIVNDVFVYLGNLKSLKYAFCLNIIFSNARFCPHKDSLEGLVEWHSDQDQSRRFGGLENWLAAKNSDEIRGALKELSKSINSINSGNIPVTDVNRVRLVNFEHQKVFNEHLIASVTKYPTTEFYLFFPPYSRLKFAIQKQSDPQAFVEYLEILRMVVTECVKHPNIHVYGFETEDFLDDIANYKDTMHYHQQFNSKMLQWMKNGDHELTPENIERYIQEISIRASSYDLQEIGAKVDAYLATKEN
jgi:hypothetical protein